MESIKDTYRNLDLYGSTVFLRMLKKHFKGVCFAKKAIPGPGSPTAKVEGVKEDLRVLRAIFHRNNEVTVITPSGNIRFF